MEEGIVRGRASMELLARMAQEDIQSTASLVDKFNCADTMEELTVLEEWLRAYIDWFDEKAGRLWIKVDIPLEEYSLLAGIQPSNPHQRRLLLDFFNGLTNAIHEKYQQGEEPLIVALEHSLQVLNVGVFGQHTTPLQELGKKLLVKLSHTQESFNKGNYESHCSRLHCLHLTLQLLKQIQQDQFDPKEDLFCDFRKGVQAIERSASYYPVGYHARLIEQSLGRLSSGGALARFQDRCRRVGKGLEGALYLFNGVRSIVALDFNIEPLKSGFKSLTAALRSHHIKAELWYDWHQAMNDACVKSLSDPDQHETFKEGLAGVWRQDASVGKQINRKALQFGAVQQLSLLALEGATAAIRESSMKELSGLACTTAACMGSVRDKDILEELLDRLAIVAKHSEGEEKEEAEIALTILTEGPKKIESSWTSRHLGNQRHVPALKEGIKKWLGGQTVNEKLDGWTCSMGSTSTCCLFSVVNTRLTPDIVRSSTPPPESARRFHEALRAHYQQPSFVSMPSLLFSERAPTHVTSTQLHLILVEDPARDLEFQCAMPEFDDEKSPINNWIMPQDRAKSDASVESYASMDLYDDRSVVMHTIVMEPREYGSTISFQNLFQRRSIQPREPEREIQRVLVVGNPGMGKTTLSRKLAYDWAQGEWGTEFEAVYVVPVRALQASKYNNLTTRREQTLATAIANESCPIQNEEEDYLQLRDQINHDLTQPTTLVVLDGLDEQRGVCELFLDEAKGGNHKLLMLSRPFDLQKERSLADIEVKHDGLNDDQMQAFVMNELPPIASQEILDLIKTQPKVRPMAHVPINLEILCMAWGDNAGSLRKDIARGGLTELCTGLARWIWERYKKKHNDQDLQDRDREASFKALGRIAFLGLRRRKLRFGKGMMERALDEGGDVVQHVLKDPEFLLLQDLGGEYQFPHSIFQEYFAGLWLAAQLLSGSDDGGVLEWIEKNRENLHYDATFSVMAEIVVGNVLSVGIQKVLDLVTVTPREVLRVVFWNVGEVGSEKVPNLMTLLASGYEDSDPSVRVVAIETIKMMIEVGQGYTTNLEELLTKACLDSDPNVRGAAIAALGSVIMAKPRRARDLVEPLIDACSDSIPNARGAAIQALGTMIEFAPRHDPNWVEPVLHGLKDSDSNVRVRAMEVIGKLIEAEPGQVPNLVEPLTNGCMDFDPNVRVAAIMVIGKLNEIAPRQASQLVDPLLKGRNDSDSNVRGAADKVIGKMK